MDRLVREIDNDCKKESNLTLSWWIAENRMNCPYLLYLFQSNSLLTCGFWLKDASYNVLFAMFNCNHFILHRSPHTTSPMGRISVPSSCQSIYKLQIAKIFQCCICRNPAYIHHRRKEDFSNARILLVDPIFFFPSHLVVPYI